MSNSIIETKNLFKIFTVTRGIFGEKKQLNAVNGVSLKINKGEALGIVGESGCGKTTVAMMLLNLLKPTDGNILLNGKEVSSFSQHDISMSIQPIFQDPYSSLNPRKSVGNIISLPLRIHRLADSKERRKKTEKIMDLVGLPKRYYNNLPNQLSGGQRQRVAIARALIMKPDIIVCDEPTSALDVSVQSQILNLLIDLQHEFNLTYIFISHNLAVVEHISTRVAVMYLGRVVEEKDTQSLFNNPEHPYTQALLKSILIPDPSVEKASAQLGIEFPNPLDPPSGCVFHPRCSYAKETCKNETPKQYCCGRDLIECHRFH